MSSELVIDVGANHGEFSLALAQKSPSTRVVAVEPIPELALSLSRAAAAAKLHNHEVIEVAVGLVAGTQILNIAEIGDSGVSSLLDLDGEGISADEYWQHRSDLSFAKQLPVKVITLAELITDLGVDTIDFLKIDAQGLDIDVLRSAGAEVAIIKAGMLEVPTTLSKRLYGEEKQDLRMALDCLHEWGFEVYGIKPNDPACNEVNVFFAQAGVDPSVVESRLGLRGLDIYDGKHFWAIPSSSFDEYSRNTAAFAASDRASTELAVLKGRLQSVQTELNRVRGDSSSREFRDLAASLSELQSASENLRLRNMELAAMLDGLLAGASSLDDAAPAYDGAPRSSAS